MARIKFPMDTCNVKEIQSDANHVLMRFSNNANSNIKMEVVKNNGNGSFVLKHMDITKARDVLYIVDPVEPGTKWRKYHVIPADQQMAHGF